MLSIEPVEAVIAACTDAKRDLLTPHHAMISGQPSWSMTGFPKKHPTLDRDSPLTMAGWQWMPLTCSIESLSPSNDQLWSCALG